MHRGVIFLEKTKIPQSELEVMKVIWSSSEELSSREIIDILSEKTGWKRTTTLTLLSKLVQKGFLNCEKKKLRSYYTALISREEYMEVETEYFFNNVHDGSLKSLITALHDNNEITAEDLDDLEAWIKNKKE